MLKKFENILKYILNKRLKYKFVKNVNLIPTLKQKRVLISYIISPLKNNLDNLVSHTNHFELLEIINYFIQRNFIIDIIDFNTDFYINEIHEEKYDIIFGFGYPYYYSSLKNKNSIKIYYATTNHVNFVKKQEEERIKYYKERHKNLVKMTHRYFVDELKWYEVSDYFILMGLSNFFELYNKPIYFITPSALYNDNFDFKKKKFDDEAKINFLWFGSTGAIHKGLDILIDVFRNNPYWKLHVCGLNKEEKKYIKIKSKNIVDHGRINIYSDYFLNLVYNSIFLLFPTCSEAFGTSISTVMRHGIIPVITKGTTGNERNKEYLLLLEDFNINYVSNYIEKLVKLDNHYLKELSEKIYIFANRKYTLDNFKKEFCKIMDNILYG